MTRTYCDYCREEIVDVPGEVTMRPVAEAGHILTVVLCWRCAERAERIVRRVLSRRVMA